MKFKDYYAILGVPQEATAQEIKRAYRKLARKYHPDVSTESDAEERFKEIAEAYEVLKDAEKRAAYDQVRKRWKTGQEFRAPPDWDGGFQFRGGGFTGARGFSDFFESLFGREFGGNRGWRTGFGAASEDRYARFLISLEEAYRGGSRTITLKIPEIDSRGYVVTRTRSVRVKIPPGVTEGQRIRLAGQAGVEVATGRPGDLYLEVGFERHRLYRADKRDIYLDLPITPWEAALGATVKVPTLGGTVEVKIPPGSQSGQKLRLKGRGLPGVPPGDEYVLLRIVTPRAETPSAREFYRRMAQHMPMDPRAELY